MYRLSLIILTVLVVSCQSPKNDNVTLKGTIDNVDDGTSIFISKLGKGNKTIPVDTAVVKNGKFEAEFPKADFQTLNILTIDSVQGNMLFINENKPLTATVYKDSLRRSKIKGGKANKLFSDYIDELKKGRDQRIALGEKYSRSAMKKDPSLRRKAMAESTKIQEGNNDYRKKLIKENPNSLTSAFVFTDLVRTKTVPKAEMQKLYDGLSSEVKKTSIAEQIKTYLNQEAARGVVAVGDKAPSFSAKTPEGKELALEDALGKYTLVDFWASWCKPCRIENPNVVRVYKKYHDKGLNILGVSLDKKQSRSRWLKAIKDDGLVWQQISNLQYWNGPIVKRYGVRSIPANFLLDENGKIIARDLRGASLDRKMEELLGKN